MNQSKLKTRELESVAENAIGKSLAAGELFPGHKAVRQWRFSTVVPGIPKAKTFVADFMLEDSEGTPCRILEIKRAWKLLQRVPGQVAVYNAVTGMPVTVILVCSMENGKPKHESAMNEIRLLKHFFPKIETVVYGLDYRVETAVLL